MTPDPRAPIVTRLNSLIHHLHLEPCRETAYLRAIARNLYGNDQYQNLPLENLLQLESLILARLLRLHPPAHVAHLQAAAHQATLRLAQLVPKPPEFPPTHPPPSQNSTHPTKRPLPQPI